MAALDSLSEYGGFTLDVRDVELLACIDEKLRWLTCDREIGYAEWREGPMVFLERGRRWEGVDTQDGSSRLRLAARTPRGEDGTRQSFGTVTIEEAAVERSIRFRRRRSDGHRCSRVQRVEPESSAGRTRKKESEARRPSLRSGLGAPDGYFLMNLL